MSDALRAQIDAALWPAAGRPLGVWAVLDGARDQRIHAALVDSRLEVRCLYSGRLPRALEMAAPQLVELPPRHRLADRLLGEGWGRAWGVLLKIDDPSNLRHHLRRFLKVRDERGRTLLFRYYDPRVLRSYLPTCTADELRTVFGPIAAFYAEDESASALLEFTFDGVRLQRRSIGAALPATAS